MFHQHGRLCKPGFFERPRVCPIYGFGMVAVLVCLWPLRHNIPVLYAGGGVAHQRAGTCDRLGAEKAVPHLLVGLFQHAFQFGRLHLPALQPCVGRGGYAGGKAGAPAVAALVALVPHTAGVVLAVPVAALFVCDLVITVLGIAHMNQDIGRIDDIVRAMRAGSDILAENIGDTALAVDRKVSEAKPAAAAKAGHCARRAA